MFLSCQSADARVSKLSVNLAVSLKKCKKSIVFALLFFCLLFFANSQKIHAREASAVNVEEQTVKALQAIDNNRWVLGRNIIAKLKDPLASKLYYWLVFTREHENPSFIRVAQFVHQNPEWPGIRSLRLNIEEEMPDNLKAKDVVAWFEEHKPITAHGMDRYLEALIFQGKVSQAKAVLSDWWAKTSLSRNKQKQIYRKYAKFIDRNAHIKRMDRMLFVREYTNARAIANLLAGGYLALAEARIALAEEKTNVNGLIANVPADLQNDSGLLYERLRWRRRQDMNDRAIEILQNPPPAAHIQNPSSWWRERHIMVRRFIEQGRYKAAYDLASAHIQTSGFPQAQAEWVSGWLAFSFLQKPEIALKHFQTLYDNVETPISKARGAYWLARSYGAMRKKSESKKWYAEAAQYQTVFYGQMAAAELGKEQALPTATLPVLTPQDKAEFDSREMMRAARLFYLAGMRDETSDFLRAFARHEKNAKAYMYTAEVANGMEHYHDAVSLAKSATKEGLLLTTQAYPVISKKMKSVDIEWALVHAIIRQESVFDQRAKSPAGALGLMQLMPATARETAGKLRTSHQNSWLTSRPHHNIKLGSAYLQQMLLRYGGSYPMAIAAYNAGPGRVDRWIKTFGDPRTGEVNLIDWLELIPIYETRNYVQRVMEAVYVYRLRLKGQENGREHPIHIAAQKRL